MDLMFDKDFSTLYNGTIFDPIMFQKEILCRENTIYIQPDNETAYLDSANDSAPLCDITIFTAYSVQSGPAFIFDIHSISGCICTWPEIRKYKLPSLSPFRLRRAPGVLRFQRRHWTIVRSNRRIFDRVFISCINQWIYDRTIRRESIHFSSWTFSRNNGYLYPWNFMALVPNGSDFSARTYHRSPALSSR